MLASPQKNERKTNLCILPDERLKRLRKLLHVGLTFEQDPEDAIGAVEARHQAVCLRLEFKENL
jgi:hypothetical protein